MARSGESATVAPSRGPEWLGWADLGALGVCVTIAVLIFTLPHSIRWLTVGDPGWVGDRDDVLYLATAARAYHEHPWRLTDPLAPGDEPAVYPWLLMGPGILVARALRLGVMGIPMAWRFLAGLGVPIGAYVLVRQVVGRPSIAAALTLILICDIGALMGRPLIGPTLILWTWIVTGRTAWLEYPDFRHMELAWRVPTPGLVLGPLLLELALLIRARREPSRVNLAASGLGFGVLFYLYHYYWMAVGLGLVLGVLTDSGKRRVDLVAGCLGSLVGLPAVVSSFWYRRAMPAGAFERIDAFLKVERTSEIIVLGVETGVLAVLLGWCWWRRRELWPVGLMASAAWLLRNHHALTGLQLQNFHFRTMVTIPLTVVLAGLLIGSTFFGPTAEEARHETRDTFFSHVSCLVSRVSCLLRRWATVLVVGLAVLAVVSGAWLRGLEATGAVSSRLGIGQYDRYRARRGAPWAATMAPGSVVAGDPAFEVWASILDDQAILDEEYMIAHSPPIDRAHWHERAALNAYLLGKDHEGVKAAMFAGLAFRMWGPWTRARAEFDRVVRERLEAFDAVRARPEFYLDRYRVRYVALPARTGLVRPGLGWRQIEAGPNWQVWERRPVGPGRASSPRREASLRPGQR